jgi:hypothetical protein
LNKFVTEIVGNVTFGAFLVHYSLWHDDPLSLIPAQAEVLYFPSLESLPIQMDSKYEYSHTINSSAHVLALVEQPPPHLDVPVLHEKHRQPDVPVLPEEVEILIFLCTFCT